MDAAIGWVTTTAAACQMVNRSTWRGETLEHIRDEMLVFAGNSEDDAGVGGGERVDNTSDL